MEIKSENVKELRGKTGAGIMDCRNALQETSGNVEKAIDWLRKKGLATAAKKAGRATSEGQVTSYIHAGGKIGVLLEVNCETDFVAKTEEFQKFIHDVSMHIAAASPLYVRREEVPANIVDAEKEIYRSQAEGSKKPAAVIEKIVTGKVDKYMKEICLLEQPFVKDTEKTVQQHLTELIAKLGENMSIRRFSRYQVGEETAKTSNSG